MKYVVIETSGRQFLIEEGKKTRLPGIHGKPGDKHIFDKVLLVKNKVLTIGRPYISGYKLETQVLRQGKEKKIIVFKYKAKTGYAKKRGHRNRYTEILVDKIS